MCICNVNDFFESEAEFINLDKVFAARSSSLGMDSPFKCAALLLVETNDDNTPFVELKTTYTSSKYLTGSITKSMQLTTVHNFI